MPMLSEADTCRKYITPKLVDAGWDQEELLTRLNLNTIVRLPNGVFAPYTPIPTNLLFFDRSGPTDTV